MKEPVIVQDNVRDRIKLDNKHDFTANLTIGLAEHGDFYLTIDFLDLTMDDLQTLARLTNLQRSIPIKSEVITKEQYNISHLVIEKFAPTSSHSMIWECLSDDPELYNDLMNPE